MKAPLQLLVLTGCFGALSANAQITWTGATDSSLTDATNWSPNTALTSTTDLVFGAPPDAAQTITIPASADVRNLTFSGATRPAYTFSGTATPTLTLYGNITVTDGSTMGVSFDSSLGMALAAGVHTIHLDTVNDPLAITSPISETGGTASVTKTGSGTLRLAGDNTYTGGTVIAAGAVVAENATGSATGAGAVSIASGATLQIGSGEEGIGGTTGAVTGPITVDGALVFARSDAVSAAAISGSGSVYHRGSGTLTFSGTENTFSGGTSIYDNGTAADAGPGAFSPNGGIWMHGGTLTVDYDETVKGLGDVLVNDDRLGGTVNLASTATLTIAGAGSDFSGTINGLGKLVIGSGAVQQLSSTESTFAGGVTLTGGTLEIAGDGSLGDAAGGLTFNGGTLRLLGGWTSARDIAFDGAGTIDTNTQEATLTGVLSGSGAFAFQGTGVLTLLGDNSGLTGGITVTNGVLDFTTTASLGADDNVITLNGGYLRTQAAVTDFLHPITLAAGGGNLNSNGFNSILGGKISGGGMLFVRAGAGAEGGSITLSNAANDYTGATTVGQDSENTAVPTLKISSDGNLGLAPSTPTPGHLILDGGVLLAIDSFTLDPNRGIAITDGGGGIGVEDGKSLLYAGNILGTGALTKTGAGNLTLGGGTGGISTFTGGLTVEAGTLTLGRSSYENITTHEFESSPVGAGTLTLLGGSTLAATPESDGLDDGILLFNNLYLGSNESITVTIDTSQDDLTLSGEISGDTGVGLLKTGAGTLTLAAQNSSFDGGFELAEGTLNLMPAAELGAGPIGAGALTLRRSTTLTLPANMTLSLANDVVLDDPNSGTGGAAIVVQQENEGFAQLELSGAITDGPLNQGAAISLIKQGTGTLKLGGASTFSGGLVVEQGAVAITTSSQVEGSIVAGPVGVGSVKLGGGTKLAALGAGSITLHNPIELGGEVGFGAQVYPLVLAGDISEGEATGSVRIGGNVTFQSTTNTYSGPTSIEQGTLTISADGALGAAPVDAAAGANHLKLFDGGLIADGSMTLASTRGIALEGSGGSIATPAGATLSYGGTISGSSSAATLVKGGDGTLVLSGSNSYTGATQIEAGSLRASGLGALPATTALGMDPGTKLYIEEHQTISRFLGSIASDVEIAMDAGKTFTVAPTAEAISAGNAGTFGGVLSGTGGFALDGASGSLLWLEGNLTYTGGTTIGADNMLKISGAATDTSALDQSIANDGLLAFYRDEPADNLTVGGSITGAGKVVSYSGFTVLTGTNNTYTGGTEINGGVLAAGADGGFGASSSPITVNADGVVALMNGAYVTNPITLNQGSTIGGNGTFASSVIIDSGVTLKPEAEKEDTIGTLAFNELTLKGGGTYDWNVQDGEAGTYDQVTIASVNTLTLEPNGGTPFTFRIIPLSASGVIGAASGFTAGQSYSFTLLSSPTIANFDTFNYTIDGSLFSSYMSGVGEWSFSLEQSGSSILLNFTPTAVPEPSTWALLITGLAVVGVGALRRRQRR